MGKIDFISLSKKKRYKISMIIVLVIGVLCLVLGLILRGTITSTVAPHGLAISFPNQEGTNNNYTATISINEYLIVNTGTDTKPLSTPIVFTLDDDAQTFLEQIPSSYRAGIFELKLKADAPNHQTGTLTIKCGNYTAYLRLTTDFTSVAN